MNILEKIKTNWKTILIIVLSLMYVGSCTTKCTYKNEIRTNNSKIKACDSTIVALNYQIDSLNHQIDLKDLIIDQKQKNVESLERTAKRNIVNVVKIDTTRLNRK